MSRGQQALASRSSARKARATPTGLSALIQSTERSGRCWSIGLTVKQYRLRPGNRVPPAQPLPFG